jgi:hypothetical protein
VHRSLVHRLTGWLVATLLLFSWTGEALGQHSCPHHDSVPGAAAHASGDGEHAAHGMAAHGVESAHHVDSAQDLDSAHDVDSAHEIASEADQDHDGAPGAESEHQHDSCTCLGSCPSATAEVFPPDPDAGLRVVPSWVRQARADDASAVTLLLLPFFLPYGQAPPLLG